MFAPTRENYPRLVAALLEGLTLDPSEFFAFERDAALAPRARFEGNVGIAMLPPKPRAIGISLDEAVNELRTQLPKPPEDYYKEMYRSLTRRLLFGGHDFRRTHVGIRHLDVARSGGSDGGYEHTKVYVQEGHLQLSRVSSRGVVINVPDGEVTIAGEFFDSSHEDVPDQPTEIHAPAINLSARAVCHPSIDRMIFHGKVMVESRRAARYEQHGS